MDKYIGMLTKVQDRNAKLLIQALMQEIEELKRNQQPVRNLPPPRDGVIEQYLKAQQEIAVGKSY